MNENEIRKYCLNCKNKPCSNNGCPLNNDIPNFIHEKDLKKAYEILCNTSVLPAICGKICPHKKQCEGSCIRGIKGNSVSIGEMEEFIGRNSIEKGYKIPTCIDENLKNKKVAIIGGGPAGLTCSAFLAKKGIKVTIYEKHDKLGGILTHGIPDFRLDKKIVDSSVQKILDLGVNIKLNQTMGKDFDIEDIKDDYDAIFISIGANIPTKMNIEGEDLKGVFGGNTLLENKNYPDFNGKKVAVIGGGNVAMDTCRTVKKLGAKEVYVIYRRAEEQMPAEVKEIEDAKNEGIKFLFQTNIVKIIGNKENIVNKIECIKTKLIQKEGEKRLSPVNIENSNYFMDTDYVIIATGSKPEESVIEEFKKDNYGYIEVDENMKTSLKNVFAGGDIIGEKQTVANAAKSGKTASKKIIEYLM